jgi:hypothetical protein
MRLHPCYLQILLLFLIMQMSFTGAFAQNGLTDIPVAFNSINLNPRVLRLQNKSVEIPTGGHLQGIQSLRDSFLIISASSGTIAYFLVSSIDLPHSKGKVKRLDRIAENPFKHAGGCQIIENRLFLGAEDNAAKDKSDIFMITLDDSARIKNTKIVAHRGGSVKRATAGAVGATRTKSGQFLFAVGDWDSRNIDFYISRPGVDSLFDSLATFQAPNNQKWCSYQAINLVTDNAGNIYLAGFGLDGTKNRADLFKVEFSKVGVNMLLVSTRFFNCLHGASFRFGAGLNITDKQAIQIYACSRTAANGITVNVFSLAH